MKSNGCQAKRILQKGVEWVNESFQIPLILVSMGRAGSRAYYKGKMVEVEPFLQENTIEATGAGSFPDYHQKGSLAGNAV